jgi:uncharacterized protein (TIGR02266 family)
MVTEQKRKNVRIVTDALVDYTGSEVLLFHKIENIGLGGMSMRTATPEPVGTEVYLTINFPDLNETIEAEGEVVWANDEEPKDMGIKFRGLSEANKEVLRRYIQEQSKRR